MSTAFQIEDLHSIAQEVFAAYVDGGEELLVAWDGDAPTFDDPVHAWVDLFGDWSGRAALSTSRCAANDLARSLLGMGADEPVSEDDLVDAFGEIANVVGGNLKSLLPTQGSLGLPCVADVLPATPGATLANELRLSWREQPIVIEVWSAPNP